jgi:DNA-binding CsgD family transcriptional regulator
MKPLEPFKELHRFFESLPHDKTLVLPDFQPFDIKGFEELTNFGSQFIYVFDFPRGEVNYVSPGIQKTFGYEPGEVNLQFLYEKIHPDDRGKVIEATIDAMQGAIDNGMTQPGRLKFSLNYRFRKKDGSYLQVLRHQTVQQSDEQGNILRTTGIIVELGHFPEVIGVTGKMVDNESGRVIYTRSYAARNSLFSTREKEIILLLANGKKTDEIAAELFISPNTVSTHRKNMLKKHAVKNTAELILFSKKQGII